MSEIPGDLQDLLAAVLEGVADASQLDRLRSLLSDRPDVRAEYLAQWRVHALLHWQHGAASREPRGSLPGTGARVGARRRVWLSAAAALLACVSLAWLALPRRAERPYLAVVEVIQADGVAVAPGQATFRVGDRRRLGGVSIREGRLRIRLAEGPEVALVGPAEVDFTGPLRLRVARGKLTADIGRAGQSLVIETAQTQVVDLGTRFGVEVDSDRHTDVVVFQGKVELRDHPGRRREPALLTVLEAGEAVRVDDRQRMSRIVNIVAGPSDDPWSTGAPPGPSGVIAAVRDNLRDPGARYYYRIVPGGLVEDARAYVAKRPEWNGIDERGLPDWLAGADLVETFGSDKFKPDLEISVSLARPANLYVLYHTRNEPPTWLTERFSDTGFDVGLEIPQPAATGIPPETGPGRGRLLRFRVWRCVVPAPGTVTLGASRQPERGGETWMYGIAARPASKE
jgi:hypothetical protein